MKLLIIGCGLAGLSGAIAAAKNGDEAVLISPFPPERSQSVMAEGGINAALDTKGEKDSPEQHFLDTMKAGCNLADEAAVRGLTNHAPALIRELADEGVVFNRDKNGDPDTRYFGGQKKSRTVFSNAGIGRQLVTGLDSEMHRYCAEKRIRLITNRKFVKCILSGGRYAGILAEDTASGELSFMTSDALMIASGGLGGLFGTTTGSTASDGAVTASLFLSGMQMANLEMIQYHPTTIQLPQKHMLISEAARGEGGRLFTMKDGKRWYFMEDWYGRNGNLMPRDVVSQCIYKVTETMGITYGGEKKVGLDLTHLGGEIMTGRLAEIADVCRRYLNLDPEKEVIPVCPGIHYFMGGIYTDRCHRTSIPGIYAAGECACQYHGANRLGGNSTLGAIYGGRVAVQTARADALRQEPAHAGEAGKEAAAEIKALEEKYSSSKTAEPGRQTASVQLEKIHGIMNQALGIVRTEEQMEKGMQLLDGLAGTPLLFAKGHAADALAAENFLLLGKAMIKSALERKESRGAQMRSDFPERDDSHFRKNMVVSFRSGETDIRTEEIGRMFS